MDNDILKKLHKEQVKILNIIHRICIENDLQYFLIGGTLLGAVRHKGFIPWDDDLDIAMPREDYNKFINIAKKIKNDKYILDYSKRNKRYWLPFIKIRNKYTIYEEEAQKDYLGNKGIWVDIFPLDNGLKDKQILIKKQLKIKKINSALQIKNLRKIKKEDSIKKKVQISLIKLIPNRILHNYINKIMSFNNKNESDYYVNFGSQYGVEKQTHLKSAYIPSRDIEFEGGKYKAPNDYDYVLKKIYGNDYMELPPIEKRITHNPIRIKFEKENEIICKKKEGE